MELEGLFTLEGGHDAGEQLMRRADRPKAVFCASDEMAFGVLYAAREAGVRVPEDLSVIGVDGHPMAELFGLSTMDQNVERQAEEAAGIAVRLIRGEPGTRSVRVRHRFVDRGSVRPPRGS